jgi:replicative DNA helicase
MANTLTNGVLPTPESLTSENPLPMLTSSLPDIHRLLPQCPDSEKGVLSSLILSPVEVHALCSEQGVAPEHFHLPAHAITFGVLSALALDAKPFDFVTVTAALREAGKLDAVGGAAFISGLSTYLPTAANVQYYLDILREKHLARTIIKIGTHFAARAYDDTETAENLASEAHSALTGLLVKKSKRQTVKETILEIVKELGSGEADGEIVKTGVAGVDGALDLYRGDLLIISAPTSCGKSALANQMLITAAVENGSRVAFYPLEMRQKQTLKRAIAVRSGNNPKYVRTLLNNAKHPEAQAYADAAAQSLMAACADLIKAPIHMRDDLYSLESIIADIRAEHGAQPFDFVCIDYLQLIRCQGRFERKQLQIAEITQRLKMVANELNLVVIVPSQQNKDGGTREAQDAEMDASSLIKIHADEEAKDVQPGRVEIWKQREGARHVDLPIKFNGLLTRFDLAT